MATAVPRNVVITGCSSGLGLGAAVEIAARGHRVFATMRDPGRDRALKEAASAAGVSVEVLGLDVTDAESIDRAVTHVLETAGTIDTVLNNAGVVFQGPLEFTTDDEVRSIFETNVYGPIRVVRAVLPSMRARKAGRIVNVSSGAARPRLGCRGIPLYAMSKAALNSFSLELCKDVAPLGIEVVMLEGAVFGNTTMTGELGRIAAAPAQDSPYRHVDEAFRLQFSGVVAPELTRQTISYIADACTMENPPLTYPPAWQQWLVDSENLSDDVFVRLCKLDRSAEIYENAGPFWPRNNELTGV